MPAEFGQAIWGKPLLLASIPGLSQQSPESSRRVHLYPLAKCNIPLLLQMSLITIRHRCELAHIGPGLAAACWVRVIRAAEAASCGLRSPHREKSRAVSGVERLL
jgi:hypothetical protein